MSKKQAAELQSREQGKKKAKKGKKYLQKAKEAGNIFKCRQAASESLEDLAARKLKKVLDKELESLIKYKSCLVQKKHRTEVVL